MHSVVIYDGIVEDRELQGGYSFGFNLVVLANRVFHNCLLVELSLPLLLNHGSYVATSNHTFERRRRYFGWEAVACQQCKACTTITNVVWTTLGPRGMDKLFHDDEGIVTISNNGTTIMKLLDIVHPATKIPVDITKSQDFKVGNGTTTVVLLAAEFLKEVKPFNEDGTYSQNLIRNYRTACSLAMLKIKELTVSIEGRSLEEKKSLLAKCASTTLSSKLIRRERERERERERDSMCGNSVKRLN
ncbi:hypothetical protein VNO77_14839 [Canavalia gladiata]|uniref:Uncharacterized protein n=1 Tax=Canavalia gladiata TaxID=3824 RepID=A0AAN9LZ21_CANGL